jgi:hypothetical protein
MLGPTLTIKKDDLLYEIIDPGEYIARVSTIPEIKANRYIKVSLQILEEGEVVTNIDVDFDIRKPRKLVYFLRSTRRRVPEDQDFQIQPATWKDAECVARIVTNEWVDDTTGEKKQRNAIVRFLSEADAQ